VVLALDSKLAICFFNSAKSLIGVSVIGYLALLIAKALATLSLALCVPKFTILFLVNLASFAAFAITSSDNVFI